MKHLTEDEFIALYYGDSPQNATSALEGHIAGCHECRKEFERLKLFLGTIDLPVPEPVEDYGEEVWRKLRPKLPDEPRSRRFGWVGLPRWAAAVAMGAL